MRAEQLGVVDAAETATMRSELPQATVHAIAAGERLLMADPAYAHPYSEVPLRTRYLELVEGDPPPADQPADPPPPSEPE